MQSQKLIRRAHWVLDKEVKECWQCKKPFNVLLRRKHHCRGCGKVFCDDCSANFVNGQYFQLQERKEKKIRFCNDCFKELKTLLKKQGIDLEVEEAPQQEERRHSKSFDTQQTCQTNDESLVREYVILQVVKNMSDQSLRQKTIEDQDSIDDMENLQTAMNVIKQELENKISALVELRSKQKNIYEQWSQAIGVYVRQAIHDVQPKDSMNIMDYIKIKKIPFQNHSATQYMKGLVIRKNVANKKMQTLHRNPKILLIKGSLDPEVQNFENLVRNEKKMIQQALESIEVLSPNIIFVEKNVSIMLLNELQRRNITVAINFSEKQLERIAEAIGAKIQKGNDIFLKKFEQCIGKCDKLIFANYDPESIQKNKISDEDIQDLEQYLAKNKNRDSTMLFISAPQSVNKISITLSGPSIKDLRNVKTCLKGIIRVAYGMYLEKEFIAIDLRFQNRMFKSKQQLITCGDITDFIYQKLLTEDEQGKYDSMELAKVKYIGANLQQIHDIQETNYQTLVNYIEGNLQNFNNKKIRQFSQLCEIQRVQQIEFYQNNLDITLEQYILQKSHLEGNCTGCKRKRMSHITILYGPECFVKIEVESKYQKLKLKENYQQKLDQSEITHMEESSYISQETLQDENNLTDSIEEKHQDNDNFIDTYIQCTVCKQKLTEQIRLKKAHLHFSYYKFIQHLLINTLRYHQKDPTCKWLENTVSECNHNDFERVFLHDQIYVKFYTNIFDIFRVEITDYNTDIVRQQTIQYDLQVAEKRKLKLLEKIQYLIKYFKMKTEQTPVNGSQTNLDQFSQTQNNLQEKLDELTNQIEIRITQVQFKDFLQLEIESMKFFIKFVEFNRILLNAFNNCEDAKARSQKIFKGVVPKSSEVIAEKVNTPTQKQDNMLALLINPKNLEKELQKQNQKKQLDLMKKSLQINSINTSKQSNVQRGSVRTDTTLEYTLNDSPDDTMSLQSVQTQQQQQQQQGYPGQFFFDSKQLRKEWPGVAINYLEYNSPNPVVPYIPIMHSSDVSIIAYGLNSQTYMTLYQKVEFQLHLNIPEKRQELAKRLWTTNMENDEETYLDIKIVIDKAKSKSEQEVFPKSPQSPFMEEDQHSPMEIQEQPPKPIIQKSLLTCKLIFFYPKQFEYLRQINNISLEQFIRSLASCSSWDSSGGKSGSLFFKSADNLFVFKSVKDSEFYMFDTFAPEYFKHMYKIHFEGQQSVLNKIYGMFELQHSKGTLYFIAMENLFYGLNDDILVYDLKGSESKRWNKKNGKTLLDTNYLIDRNGEPLPLRKENYVYVRQALIKDSEFLDICNVVDYSLLLIIDKINKRVKMGIIDYLQQYNLQKKLENRFKTVINFGFDPTIVKPTFYKTRFLVAMDKYFMGINQAL